MTAIAEAKINVRALSLADTADFGILRLITDRPDDALSIVRSYGYIARLSPVLAVAMAHEPGSLAKVLRALSDAGAEIEYMYASVAGSPDYAALAIIAIAGLPKTYNIAEQSGVRLLTSV